MFDAIVITQNGSSLFLDPRYGRPFEETEIRQLDGLMRARLEVGCQRHNDTDRLVVVGRRFYEDLDETIFKELLRTVYDVFGRQRLYYEHAGVVECIETDGVRWTQNDGSTIYADANDSVGWPANP